MDNNSVDNALVKASQAGDDMAMEELLNKYKSTVRMIARGYYIVGGESEDLAQEGMIGLYKAVKDYDADKDASFKTFASMCINRQIITAVRASQCKKHSPLNSSLSFDSMMVTESGEEKWDNGMTPGVLLSPEDTFFDKENVKTINETMWANLSKYEKEVFEMYLEGLTYIQIADNLNKTPKSVDNAIQRIKVKLQKILNI